MHVCAIYYVETMYIYWTLLFRAHSCIRHERHSLYTYCSVTAPSINVCIE